MKSRFHVGGQLHRLGTGKDLNGFPRLVDDHRAVFTMLQVPLQFLPQHGV